MRERPVRNPGRSASMKELYKRELCVDDSGIEPVTPEGVHTKRSD